MSGRDQAFEEYVVARRPRLYRTAYLLCGDPHRAEDLVQTALTRVYVAWARAERSDSVDAYVRRALVNASIDESRRPWRRERPSEAAGEDEVVHDACHGDHDDLWTALRSLSPGQRRVVVLRHYWGLSVEETAADLGVSTGTVKSQTADAIRHLRVALATADTHPRGHHDDH